MATALDLIEGALRLIGALASGEGASNEEAQQGLSALNDLIDSLSNERLAIHELTRDTYTLTASHNPHTIGTAGDLASSTRPLKIEGAGLIESGQNIEHPIEIIPWERWKAIADKTVASSIPYSLWYEAEFPLGKIWLYPVCNAANTLALYTWKALSRFAALTTDVSLPEGYSRMLRYNLALDFAPEYGKTIDPAVAAIALESKANVKNLNAPIVEMLCDSAIPGGRAGRWDYRTGDWRWR